MGKIFVISGGAGFIGSHLCERLVSEGNRVICVDNLITGRKDNIESLNKDSNFEFIEHDVSKPLEIPGKVDYIFHFASPASPIDFVELAIQILKVGALGSHNLLGMARAKSAKFVLASTSEVYGDPLEHPQKETYWGNVNVLGERGVYDESKRFAEALTSAYQRKHKIKISIARIFNTYGPRMRADDGRVVPNFIKQAISNSPLTIYGEGTHTRSFCYVSDLLEGILRLALKSDYQLPVNIGSDIEISVKEFAQTVLDVTGSKSTLTYLPLPEDDPKLRRPDLSLAREKLNFEVTVPLKEGLEKTVEYFRKHYR